MDQQLALDSMSHMAEKDAQPFAARELESWDEIAIAGHRHDCLHGASQRKPRDVEADAEIHSLLFDGRHEIFRLDQAGMAHQIVKCTGADFPSIRGGLTESQRKVRDRL